MSTLELRVHISKNIISPALELEAVKAKAVDLGFKGSLDREQAGDLYNAIVGNLLEEIQVFMQSEEALQICKDVRLYSSSSSFNLQISKTLEKQIRAIYGIEMFPEVQVSPPLSLSTWLWSIIGFGGSVSKS